MWEGSDRRSGDKYKSWSSSIQVLMHAVGTSLTGRILTNVWPELVSKLLCSPDCRSNEDDVETRPRWQWCRPCGSENKQQNSRIGMRNERLRSAQRSDWIGSLTEGSDKGKNEGRLKRLTMNLTQRGQLVMNYESIKGETMAHRVWASIGQCRSCRQAGHEASTGRIPVPFGLPSRCLVS